MKLICENLLIAKSNIRHYFQETPAVTAIVLKNIGHFLFFFAPSACVMVILSRSWIILDNLIFLAKILDFSLLEKILDFFPRSWQSILPRNRTMIKILATNPTSGHWKSEKKITNFLKYILGYKYFSSKVSISMKFGFSFILQQKRKVYGEVIYG